jgi:hypothetical protein
MMSGHGKSDSPIVPGKFSNKTCLQVAEEMEGRGLAKRGASLSKTRPGRRAGKACTVRLSGYGKCIFILWCASALSPEARAVCGSAACTDLCGGRWVTSVPTATPRLILVTNNVKHFKKIESLKVTNWIEKTG